MAPSFLTAAAVPIRTCSRAALVSRRRPSFAARRNRGLSTSATMPAVTPAEAHARKSQGWKHLDVRTEGEFATTRAPDSVNIPFMNRGPGGMAPNPGFLDAVAQKFGKTDQIIVSCASGIRSARACTALSNAGYTNLVDMEGGMGSYSCDPALPKEP